MSLPDPTDPKAQQKAEADARRKSKLRRSEEQEDIQWLMAQKRGRRIVWRLLGEAGVFRSTFNSNAMQMAFAEGHRNFGNQTLSLITTHCADQFLVMLKEHRDSAGDRNEK